MSELILYAIEDEARQADAQVDAGLKALKNTLKKRPKP